MSKFLRESFDTWYTELQPIINHPEFNILGKFISKKYKESLVFPKKDRIFEAFKQCKRKDLKIVWIGQDPYHDEINKGVPRATGLAFGNHPDTSKLSPSLRIIHGELENNIKEPIIDFDCSLESWAKQGILLLNTALTVEKGKPNSHSKEWKWFTESVIKHINDNNNGLVWVLLGKHAQSYKQYINTDFHHIVEAAHPAAECYKENAGFIGSKIFNQIDDILNMMNGETIKWKVKFST